MKMKRPELDSPETEIINLVFKKHRQFKRRRKIVGLLAMLVLVVSCYAMMRPAITMEQGNFYGQSSEAGEEITVCGEVETASEAAPCGTSADVFAKAAPSDESRRLEKLELGRDTAVSGEEIPLSIRFSGTNKDWVREGDYISVVWSGTGAARLDCTFAPTKVFFKKTKTVIATTALETGRLTITFTKAAETVTGLKRWADLELLFTAFIEPSYPGHSAVLTVSGGSQLSTVTVEKANDYYSIYDSENSRRVIDPQGNTDAEWSLCLNHLKASPGSSSAATGEYVKIVNPTAAQYAEFSGNNDPENFIRVKRILYAKAALYPDYSYGVFQNELYYAVTGLEKYNANYSSNPELNAQKLRIRAAADSDEYDSDIENGLEVVIYRSNDSRLQNTITAAVKISIPVTKLWNGTPTDSVTVRLLADGTEIVSQVLSEQNGWHYVFEHLDKYNSDGARIMYTLAEDTVYGYETVITGGCDFGSCGFTVTNTEIGTAELTLKKLVTGTGNKNKGFLFTVNIVDGGGRPMSGEYKAYRGDMPETVFFDDDGNAEITLKHDESIRITGLQSGFYFIINEAEANQNGYTTSVERPNPDEQDDSCGGVNNWNSDSGVETAAAVTFTNHRDAPAEYPAEIVARKTLGGGLPRDGQFTFILTDSTGRELERRRNDAEGNVSFQLELPNYGTYSYTLRELNDGQGGITYDERVYNVQITAAEPALQGVPPKISVSYDGAFGGAEFRNMYSYMLPETGGAGVKGYIGGGAALVSLSLISLFVAEFLRRKEGRPQKQRS